MPFLGVYLLRFSHTLVEEPNDLTGDVLAPCLLVVHDTGGGGENEVAELTRGQQPHDPLLEIVDAHVVPRVDDARLVDAAVQLDDDLAVAVVVDLLELADVT